MDIFYIINHCCFITDMISLILVLASQSCAAPATVMVAIGILGVFLDTLMDMQFLKSRTSSHCMFMGVQMTLIFTLSCRS